LLLLEYDAAILQELIENQNGLAGVDSFGVLFDNNQIYLAHGSDPTMLYKIATSLELPQIEALITAGRLPNLPPEQLTANLPDLSTKLKEADEEPFFSTTNVAADKRTTQAAVTKTTAQPWQVGFFQPEDIYLSIVNQQTRLALLFLATIAVIVAALSFGATRLISTPIIQLTDLVEHVAAGDLTLQVPVLTQDEIGRLAVAFNALTAQIRNLLGGLELQVAERTKSLERQAIQLQTAAEVARDASNIQDIDELLERTVNLIHDRFGFYHAGIFLLDERAEYAVLRSANSEGGKEMLRRGHRLKVGQTGIVGFVTGTGEPRIALDGLPWMSMKTLPTLPTHFCPKHALKWRSPSLLVAT
jgi:methyl-accepting chemotaxis protein